MKHVFEPSDSLLDFKPFTPSAPACTVKDWLPEVLQLVQYDDCPLPNFCSMMPVQYLLFHLTVKQAHRSINTPPWRRRTSFRICGPQFDSTKKPFNVGSVLDGDLLHSPPTCILDSSSYISVHTRVLAPSRPPLRSTPACSSGPLRAASIIERASFFVQEAALRRLYDCTSTSSGHLQTPTPPVQPRVLDSSLVQNRT